ncbi:hypothetical protein GCK72_008290 [Caenorhabditis remanei]|uniref:Uncharacterized protein n=1 Tax=Caenorhabditis remanei TaxID=31234 RepID=A0A6A5GZU1_CAERE|nr:hypothetical protein GCK72_008290 [Caenorhabditis remanei]KAF1760044.1 hypothetical protein GCK72_008290 [Caenorhabditis remanei]
MADQKISILGVTIAISFILNGVGVFTPAWIVDTASVRGYSISASIGIVPYYTENPGWFQAASILMFTSFALFIIMALNFLIIFHRVHQSGYSCGMRKRFHSLALAAVFIIGNTITAVILIGVNETTFNDGLQKFTLGYSAWLCVASAAISVGTLGLSLHIATKDCH